MKSWPLLMARLVLIIAVILHIIAAYQLARISQIARRLVTSAGVRLGLILHLALMRGPATSLRSS